MAASLSGLVSGIDVQSLITNLSAAYQAPITLLQNQESTQQTTLSAWGTLQSSLSSLQSALASLQNIGSTNNRTATVTNGSLATATASANAQPGSYNLSNIVLAQAQSVYSQSFANTSSGLGTGTLQIQVGSGAVQNVVINSDNDSLDGIAQAINQANVGVTAGVIYDGSGYRLTLTGTQTGVDQSFTVAVSGATGSLGSLSYSSGSSGGMSLSQAAQNASLSINGLAVTSSSNTISGAIPGVTLNLLQASSGSTTLQVSANNSAFVTTVQSFVSAFNKTMTTINQLTAYNAQAGSGGPLLGNAAVNGLRTQLLNLISNPGVGLSSGASYNSLGSVGLGLSSSGTISLNASTLQTALSADYQDVVGLFGQAGQSSNSSVQYVGASGSTQAGVYAVNISQAASRATITAASAFPSGGLAQSESLTFASGSQTVVVGLSAGSSLAAVVNTINATLQQSGMTGITASNDNGILQLQSTQYGSAQAFTVSSDVASGGTGIGTRTLAASGTDVMGTVNGQATSGVGQNMTVTGPGNALGLQLKILGTSTGNLGTVSLSQGLYQQMNSLLNQALNSQNGFISAAQNGINSTINGLNAQIATLQQSASNQTALLTQQFAAMQAQLASLQSTGQYLNAFYAAGSSSSSSSSSSSAG
ncbi:flagellar filament capping protein FliD [Candidatus Igneacidithiobacillus taiwanensis]|uniref:flagellar filament capping protein FliD n=1 Tax=Candidatus Igneacidithiobacillus taiwanensis TaxID=1945924 RepID=UPI0028997F62|nr:flagellar filament capping protein FliD [Candidatus Igneacidithiobacillus taiwanensis]